jgi:nicotinate-nucleotide pyrophosphorylase (carboxylating)
MSTAAEIAPLPHLLIEPLVRAALAEDLGRAGDITSDAVIPAGVRAETAIVARQPGRVAGLDLALTAWRLLEPGLVIQVRRADGSDVAPGDEIAFVTGPARAMLTGERVALNFMGRLCGIATATREIVAAVSGTKARITCTRKTTPGLRALEKYAVRIGGGVNHRFGLDDGVLIKDNHIAVAGGIATAVERARRAVGDAEVSAEAEAVAGKAAEEAEAASKGAAGERGPLVPGRGCSGA